MGNDRSPENQQVIKFLNSFQVGKKKISDSQGQRTLQSVVGFAVFQTHLRLYISVLVTCKNEEDPIKSEGDMSIFQTLKGSLLHCQR